MSLHDDLVAAQAHVTSHVLDRLQSLAPKIVVAPSVHDAHHAHELCGQAVRDAVEEAGAPRAVWWWRLWGQGGPPTLIVDCEDAMPVLRAALAAHAGEVQRNRYLELLEAEAQADAVRGSEQVFGFGSHALDTRAARVFCETLWDRGQWRFGEPRVFGDTHPGDTPLADAGPWLRSASSTASVLKASA